MDLGSALKKNLGIRKKPQASSFKQQASSLTAGTG